MYFRSTLSRGPSTGLLSSSRARRLAGLSLAGLSLAGLNAGVEAERDVVRAAWPVLGDGTSWCRFGVQGSASTSLGRTSSGVPGRANHGERRSSTRPPWVCRAGKRGKLVRGKLVVRGEVVVLARLVPREGDAGPGLRTETLRERPSWPTSLPTKADARAGEARPAPAAHPMERV